MSRIYSIDVFFLLVFQKCLSPNHLQINTFNQAKICISLILYFAVIYYKLVAATSLSLIQFNSSVGFKVIYTVLTCAEHLI